MGCIVGYWFWVFLEILVVSIYKTYCTDLNLNCYKKGPSMRTSNYDQLEFLKCYFPFTVVPEGSFIVRAHTPMSNLFSCLWFNEVNRFTSRDQLSFAYTYLKLRRLNPDKPFYFNMFMVRIICSSAFSGIFSFLLASTDFIFNSTALIMFTLVWFFFFIWLCQRSTLYNSQFLPKSCCKAEHMLVFIHFFLKYW